MQPIDPLILSYSVRVIKPVSKRSYIFPFFSGNSLILVSLNISSLSSINCFLFFGDFFHMNTDQITLFCTLLSFFFFFFLLSVCSSGLQSIWIVVWLTNWFFNWIHLAIQPIYWDFFQLLNSVFSEFPFGFMASYFTACFQYSPFTLWKCTIQVLDILCLIMLHQVRVHYCCSFIAVALLRSPHVPLSSCLLRHINHLSWWWVFGEGDNAKAITCAWPIRAGCRLWQNNLYLCVCRNTQDSSIIYLHGTEGWRSAEDASLPRAALLIHWPAGACLFPEAKTRWVLVFPGNGRKKRACPKTLLHFINAFFPTWRPHHLQLPGVVLSYFLLTCQDPLASLWLLFYGVCAGLDSHLLLGERVCWVYKQSSTL